MNAIFNTMTVTLMVKSIDKNNDTCVVEYKFEHENKVIDSGVIEDAIISRLTTYRFFNHPKFVLDKKYVAENNSTNYNDCPIKLVRTTNKKGQLIYIVKVLNEGSAKKHEFSTPMGKIVNSWSFTTLPPKKWLRYSDYYDYNKARMLAQKDS